MLLSEQLVGEARQRNMRRMSVRERRVSLGSALLFVAAACVFAIVAPVERETDIPLTIGLTLAYALVMRVKFEFGEFFVSPEQLVLVPVFLLCPLPLVPALVAFAGALSILPDIRGGTFARDRWVGRLSDSWFCIGAVVVLALFAPGEPTLDHSWVYAAALGAQLLFDALWTLTRNTLIGGLPIKEVIRDFSGTARLDVILSPIALMFAVPAAQRPLVLLTVAPLIWMLDLFAKDRQARYANALELQRAYRGTVTLLSDVVEFEDPYTAAHSRSIVELAEVTANKLGVPREQRQRLEFVALLHDVGKITIPKEILNKPASLTEEEFAVMRTHTIEDQFMLDRVGGLLGEIGQIVRSCHERWDGGGYPDGLAGDEIPLIARIVFTCDAYNAMTTDRVYRRALSVEEAKEELRVNAGTQFDPVIVDALFEVIEEGEPAIATTDGIRAILSANPAVRQLTPSA